MNRGTRIRLVALILINILTICVMFQIIKLPFFGIALVSLALLSISGISYYFNNDWTEIACKYTGLGRQEKLEQKESYVGDFFFTDDEKEAADE